MGAVKYINKHFLKNTQFNELWQIYPVYENIFHSKKLSHTSLLSIPPLLLLLLLSGFSRVQLCATPWQQPIRLPRPWDSPGKNTGVGCHFLLQCMKVKSESEAAQSFLTLSHPMDCSLPGSSVHGIFQARVLEWGATAFSSFLPLLLGKHWSVSCPYSVAFYEMLHKWNHRVGSFIYKFFHSA